MNSLHHLLSAPLDIELVDIEPKPESAQMHLFPIKSAQGAIQKLPFFHGYYRIDSSQERYKRYCECRDHDPSRHANCQVTVFEETTPYEGPPENNPKALSQLIEEIEQMIDSLTL